MRRLLTALLASTIAAAPGAARGDDAPGAKKPAPGGARPQANPAAGHAPPAGDARRGASARVAADDEVPEGPVFHLPGEPAPRRSLRDILDGRLPAVQPQPVPASVDLPQPAPDERPHEIIEVVASSPPAAGVIAVDGAVARTTAGALGEPFRVLGLLPGVTTSVGASGYPIVRGSLPGETRFAFDGIELPMLYHLLLGTEVVHPSFIGGVELRAGGHGAAYGHLLGGSVALTPADDTRQRTELRADLVQLGAFRAQPLSRATSIAVAARVGTLDGAAKLYDSDTTLHYVDQQTRLVHRFDNGDELALTSLGAYDYVQLPPDPGVETLQLGFHRLDARWTRRAASYQLRAGLTSELDSMRSAREYMLDQPMSLAPAPRRRGSSSYGARAYGDGEVTLARWLTARGGLEAHARMLDNREPLFVLGHDHDPYLTAADAVDSEGAWSELAIAFGPVTVTPGVRGERYDARVAGKTFSRASIDPRLAITWALPRGTQLELAGGRYTAPPQVSVIERSIMLGPLPSSEGTGAAAGLSRGYQAQAALRTLLPAGIEANLAAYARDTDYAIDFGMVDKPIPMRDACDPSFASSEVAAYRHVGVRAVGMEAMVRRAFGDDVSGWLSYSLGKVDRDLGFTTLPHELDQRHTVSATAQWRLGSWTLGASGNMHTGRPYIYPQWAACSAPDAAPIDVIQDPTHLRRPGASYRLDLRAERAFAFAGWSMRVSVELQNATLTREVTGYDLDYGDPFDPSTYRVTEKTLFLPLPMAGLEIDL